MPHATAQTSAPPRPEVDEVLRALARRRRIPGLALAVTSSSGLLHATAVGTADLRTGRPTTPTTPHLWFSLTKVATATLAMHLHDRGLLDLDAPVASYLPWLPADRQATPMRVGQLLNHTSGLANPLPLRWARPAGAPPRDAEAFARALVERHGTARYPRGGPARYSNLGYLVLGQVIASATGRPFEQALAEAVLAPLGMARTSFTHAPGTATGYVRAPRGAGLALRALLPAGTVGRRVGAHVALEPFVVEGAAYGGLVGDAVDAARLARLHLADGAVDGTVVLRPATARRMRAVDTPGRPYDLGLGWFRSPGGDGRPAHVEHLGGGGGFFNAMRLYPELDLGFVVMANTTARYDHHALLERLRQLPWA